VGKTIIAGSMEMILKWALSIALS